MRLFLLFFTFFGLLVALPLVVWDIASRHAYAPVAVLLTFLAMLVPMGIIGRCSFKVQREDAERPVRFDVDAAIRASFITGMALGVAAVLWLVF